MDFKCEVEKQRKILKELEDVVGPDMQKWIISKVYKKHPHWKNLEEYQREYYAINYTLRLISYIQEEKPADIKKFIENELSDELRRSIINKEKEISTYGYDKELISWIKGKIVETDSSLADYKKNPKNEDTLLFRIKEILPAIKNKNPKDVRAFVISYFKEKQFDTNLLEISKEVWTLKTGQQKKYGDVENRLLNLLQEAEKQLPGFSESRSRMISEIQRDLTALKTNGKTGSVRMIQRLANLKTAKKGV